MVRSLKTELSSGFTCSSRFKLLPLSMTYKWCIVTEIIFNGSGLKRHITRNIQETLQVEKGSAMVDRFQ